MRGGSGREQQAAARRGTRSPSAGRGSRRLPPLGSSRSKPKIFHSSPSGVSISRPRDLDQLGRARRRRPRTRSRTAALDAGRLLVGGERRQPGVQPAWRRPPRASPKPAPVSTSRWSAASSRRPAGERVERRDEVVARVVAEERVDDVRRQRVADRGLQLVARPRRRQPGRTRRRARSRMATLVAGRGVRRRRLVGARRQDRDEERRRAEQATRRGPRVTGSPCSAGRRPWRPSWSIRSAVAEASAGGHPVDQRAGRTRRGCPGRVIADPPGPPRSRAAGSPSPAGEVPGAPPSGSVAAVDQRAAPAQRARGEDSGARADVV